MHLAKPLKNLSNNFNGNSSALPLGKLLIKKPLNIKEYKSLKTP